MRATRRRDTALELAVRAQLEGRGNEFRVDAQPIPALGRRADVLFERERVAIYLDGCFWHGCPAHGTWPQANAEFWREKIRTNQARDRDSDRRLRDAGWTVLRYWEHEDASTVARDIHAVVAERASRGLSVQRSE
jgi:DNA mismatch endonuclease (patch repair protein)